MECAIALTELHIQSVIEIADSLAPDRDARDERAVLRAFSGDVPITWSEALRRSKLNSRRGQEAFRTLQEKGIVARAPDDGALDKPPVYSLAERSNVIPFRRPAAALESVKAVALPVEEENFHHSTPVSDLF